MPFLAPDADTQFTRFMRLHPSGDAWDTGDIWLGEDAEESFFRRFWHGIANYWANIEQAVVNLLSEYSCATILDDNDLWLSDYDDGCGWADADLCGKVQEAGFGQDLAFYQLIATSLGYAATFAWVKNDHGYGGVYSTLLVTVDGPSSPGFGLVPVGEFRLGIDRLGGDYTTLLSCVLSNVVPAHIAVIYVVT